jgi:hypothetical protein
MKTWIKLLVPVLLGLFAVYVNSSVINRKLQPRDLVIVRGNLKAGEVFSSSSIQRASFPGNIADLFATAIPWQERAVLIGREVPRDLREGDLVLWRDATPPARELQPEEGEVSLPVSLSNIDFVPQFILVGEEIGFFVDGNKLKGAATRTVRPDFGTGTDVAIDIPDFSQSGVVTPVYVGPFRVLSVGRRLTRTEGDEPGTRGGDSRILTVATKLDASGNADPNADKLLRVSNGQSGGLLAIVLHRSNVSPAALQQRYNSSNQ